ncbi:MAG: helix-turn-helix transcriptional regulator [Deltaproteobacteria bacterium]|nr:helix-turn-helix transcriptional regulator [Deltaproteobacteria bacterium]
MSAAEKLGHAVRRSRRAAGLSQSELAAMSGAGLNFISQLERGKATVRLELVFAVLHVLGLELHLQRGKSTFTVEEELS